MQLWHVGLLGVAWAVYGGTSFAGSLVAASAKTTSPVLVLYWMLIGRACGCTAAAVLAVALKKSLFVWPRSWWQAVAPAMLPMVGNVGWVTYFALSKTQHVSVLMPLLSIYVVIPLGFALACGRERCSLLKVLGCALVLATGVLLGLEVGATNKDKDARSADFPGLNWTLNSSLNWNLTLYPDSNPNSTTDTAAWTAGLFVITLVSWGLSDTISSSVPKAGVTTATLLTLNAAGYVVNTAVVGVVVHVMHSAFSDAATWVLLTWAAVNVLYPVGWTAYTSLCRSHDGVVVVPLFGMYILVPAVGGLVLAHEAVSPFTVAGVACGVAASILLAWKASSVTSASSIPPTPTPTLTEQEEEEGSRV
jgi:drug/metabolite transporter (DMT)-like permease